MKAPFSKEFLIKAFTNKDLAVILHAQKELSPLRDFGKKAEMYANASTKISAVLILLYPQNKKTHFVLTQRHNYNGVHSGQISLPGGKKEITDSSLMHTAIRETREEIGVKIDLDNIIAEGESIYIAPSNFLVYPFIALLSEPPTFEINQREVAQLIEVPLQELLDANIGFSDKEQPNSLKTKTPYYLLQNKQVWGATACILAELKSVTTQN